VNRRTAFFLDFCVGDVIINYIMRDWNKTDICNEIRKITYNANDGRMDGFVTWGHKQDLYEILWFVEDELAKCSTYADEDDYVKKHEQHKLLEILGKK